VLRQHDIAGVTVKVVWISDAVTQCEAEVMVAGPLFLMDERFAVG
jgi:hypothetical protein